MVQRLVLLVALFLAADSAYAGSYTVNFLAFHQGGWQEGYPYYGNINGGPTIDIMCDDYAHGGEPGQSWYVNFTDLGTSNLSLLRFNKMNNALTLYQEVGWILLETRVTPQNQWTDMNSAVWNIFDSKAKCPDSQCQNWLNMAQQEAANGFPGTDFNLVGIYTPLDQYDNILNDPQELMTILPNNIPEPSTLILLSTGLAGLVARKLLS